ncbi:hypothetical protein [Streptomyces sp. CB00455]|uniref:hypothetical protein n=1 Tax=Streptomyces sp. CB00455 TaxID=1703927 RepID=UPI00093CD6A6|nr:hypothetical protein [Streptomyces sp. CB00455]
MDFASAAVEAYTVLGCVTPDGPLAPPSGTAGMQHVVDGTARAARHGGPLREAEAADRRARAAG